MIYKDAHICIEGKHVPKKTKYSTDIHLIYKHVLELFA